MQLSDCGRLRADKMLIPPNYCLFACTYSDDAVTSARDYVTRNGLTENDVRLRREDDMVLVLTKRELEWAPE